MQIACTRTRALDRDRNLDASSFSIVPKDMWIDIAPISLFRNFFKSTEDVQNTFRREEDFLRARE